MIISQANFISKVMGTIKSKIFKEKGLLVQIYSGELNKNDLAVYFATLYFNPEYLDVSIIYSDFTNAIVALTDDDIVDVAKFILINSPKVRHVDNAILVIEPLVTSYSYLYKQIMNEMPLYDCQIFSTFKEATAFIKYNSDELIDLIQTMLKE
jgi:hypothetical protein